MQHQTKVIKVSETSARHEIHFTGGLRGFQTSNGWALIPVSPNENSDALLFKDQKEHYKFVT